MIIENFWMFAVAALLLNLTPGNDMLFVAGRSAGQGIKAGVVSAFGIMAGCMVHILAAVIGLSTIIAKSATAFDIIKYSGAVYLMYLGFCSLLSKKKKLVVAEVEPLAFKKIFWQGAITNVLNPKVALFFLAFLPQFIHNKSGNTEWQIFFLGTWFTIGGTLVNIIIAVLFGKIAKWLARSPRFVQWQQQITGLVLIALGIKISLSSRQ